MGTKQIQVLSDSERMIVEKIKSQLHLNNRSRELSQIISIELALTDLARAISLYPEILKEQSIGHEKRSLETLINDLCNTDIADMDFHIPTKAILGQSFTVAKINFLFLLHYCCHEEPCGDNDEEQRMLFRIISRNIFTIMVEEIFSAIIADRNMEKSIRTNAAYLLMNIWENRLGYGIMEFAPVMNNIWRARRELSPSYGTMMGISELFRISDKCDPILLEFLQRESLSEDEVYALSEFLMGISYEESVRLRQAMQERGQASLSREEVDSILKQRVYPDYFDKDPRDIIKSFRHRKNHAMHRMRLGLEGPKKTIEEYIMCFLLSRPETWINR